MTATKSVFTDGMIAAWRRHLDVKRRDPDARAGTDFVMTPMFGSELEGLLDRLEAAETLVGHLRKEVHLRQQMAMAQSDRLIATQRGIPALLASADRRYDAAITELNTLQLQASVTASVETPLDDCTSSMEADHDRSA